MFTSVYVRHTCAHVEFSPTVVRDLDAVLPEQAREIRLTVELFYGPLMLCNLRVGDTISHQPGGVEIVRLFASAFGCLSSGSRVLTMSSITESRDAAVVTQFQVGPNGSFAS